jgi:proteasome lid subunit RPN8/RPN11
MKRQLEAAYPNEGCGIFFMEKDGRFTTRPMQNVYDRYHEKDPARFPRTSRTAYLFDPKEWLAATEEAEGRGAKLSCIYHSHGDVGAYFSKEDRDMAAPDGEPILPDVVYLVVAVDGGRATGAKAYRWRNGDFEEKPISLD